MFAETQGGAERSQGSEDRRAHSVEFWSKLSLARVCVTPCSFASTFVPLAVEPPSIPCITLYLRRPQVIFHAFRPFFFRGYFRGFFSVSFEKSIVTAAIRMEERADALLRGEL